jgi:hypothetical protein
VVNQIKEFLKVLKANRKASGIITGILFAAFRYMAYQVEYNKDGWAQERILRHADDIRCQEERARWKTQDSIRSQQIWDKAFNNARDRILQPVIDSIRKS